MLRYIIPRRTRDDVMIRIVLGRYPRTPLHRAWAYICTGWSRY